MRTAALVSLCLAFTASAAAKTTIVTPPNPSALETLAALEVRRYFYLRTGELPAITGNAKLPAGNTIVVASQGRPPAPSGSLGPQQYTIRSDGRAAVISGGDDTGTLYGAYRFAELLGVRFYLHGDVVPDTRISPAALPRVEETGKPLFQIRGLQPFHDFPEGPDWWNQDDYLAYVAQLPKLRMNFLGLHNYPEGHVGPEPGVWIGRPADLQPDGKVAFSYPSQWANTARKDMWGYAPMDTSEFRAGADLLFETDRFGPEVMRGLMPAPDTPAGSNRLFDDAGQMLRSAFAAARQLGVKTCIGTETPLTIPKLVQERLRRNGQNPDYPAVVRELYRAMFRRIAALYPVDYYWLWTPEDWTWGGNKPEQFEATVRDIRAALGALEDLGKPFTLATSGWVLGPQSDRAALDRILPPDSPMSCINRKVGHAPDEPGFANVSGRPKWVIPWLENDPNLLAPQPWVGRMRYDAVDARRLGCDGLLGIHWRTKILGPNIAALAAAGWDQSWVPAGFDTSPIPAGKLAPDAAAEGEGHDHPQRARAMPVAEFYLDFARANFGEAVAPPAGAIFSRIDGASLPEPSTWIKGPGGIRADTRPWAEVKPLYAFVDQLEALLPRVQGAGNRQRFEYWLNTYRTMRAMAEAGCLRGQLDAAAKAIRSETDAARRKALAQAALPARVALARTWERLLTLQLAAADTPGELGTLANIEQHNRRFLKFLEAHDADLQQALAAPLPPEIELAKGYTGPARLMVPTQRTLAARGESLTLKVFALDASPVRGVTVFWRPMGAGKYKAVAARNLARAVWAAGLPPAAGDFEYYVRAETSGGKTLHWPATAPALSQTVVTGLTRP